jgi:adenylosuccinate lyase
MGLPPIIAGNAAHSLLERTLDDSAARRVVLPEAFLALDEALLATHHVLANLVVNQPAIDRNLRTYGPFAGTERLLLEWVRRYGFSRQALHEIIRDASLATWKVLQDGSETQPEQTLVALLSQAGMVSGKVPGTSEHVQQEVAQLLDPRGHIGDAAERSIAFAALVLQEVRELAVEHPTEEPVF